MVTRENSLGLNLQVLPSDFLPGGVPNSLLEDYGLPVVQVIGSSQTIRELCPCGPLCQLPFLAVLLLALWWEIR